MLASSAGDTDEYTKMLIRQEIDTRMVDIEEKMETMINQIVLMLWMEKVLV